MMIKKRVVKRTSGLSLIELLVVVAILAALSMVTVSLVDNIDSKERYRETVNRLSAIRSAILGPEEFANADFLTGGFLQDIGWPPVNATDLIDRQHSYWSNSTVLRKYDTVWRITYGWAGPYMTGLPLRKNETFPVLYDGWGNEFNGWEKKDKTLWIQEAPVYPHEGEEDKADFAIQSYGADGKPGGTEAFDGDIPHQAQPLIPYWDWTVDIKDWPIEIINESDDPLVFNSGFRFMIVIPHWLESPPDVQLDFWPPNPDNPNDTDQYGGHIGGAQTAVTIDPHSSHTFFFGGGSPPNSVHRWVPYGRRMFFIVKDVAGSGGNAERFTDFTPGFKAGCACDNGAGATAEYACVEVPVSRRQSKWQIKFYN